MLFNLYYYYMCCFFIFGFIAGGILNVFIFKIPKDKIIVTVTSSDSKKYNYNFKYYKFFSIFNYFFYKKYKYYVKAKILHQYLIIKFINAICWVIIYYFFNGLNFISIIYCFFVSSLLYLSIVDIRVGVVSDKINIFIFILGFIIILIKNYNWINHILGFFLVIVLFLIPFLIKGIGGGDIKLFAVCGFFIGWKLILTSFIFAHIICSLYSIFIIIKYKATRKTSIKFVPFIAIGVFISIFYGDWFINWYITGLY